jgi:CheY-like chemotaxis protein
VAGLPATLAALRGQLQAVTKAGPGAGRVKQLQEMRRSMHALTGQAGLAGLQALAQMSEALEALLQELSKKPLQITPSTLRTVAAAVDFLATLCERGVVDADEAPSPASILVVDDEPLSRRAISRALEKAKLKSVNVEHPEVAYRMLSETRFDLVFLDVDMPAMNGFELCAQLRKLPGHQRTPVVFVTKLNDFASRAKTMTSGGNDFIAKPFLFMELAVKALVYLLRARLKK